MVPFEGSLGYEVELGAPRGDTGKCNAQRELYWKCLLL